MQTNCRQSCLPSLSAVCLQLADKVCPGFADKLQTKFVRDLQTKSGQTLSAKCRHSADIDGSEVCLLMSNFVCFADIHRQSCFIKLGGPDKVGQCLSGHTLSAKCLQLPDNHYIRRQLIFSASLTETQRGLLLRLGCSSPFYAMLGVIKSLDTGAV